MRALSSFDRWFLIGAAVALILTAPVLWQWHRHWCAVLATIATIRPHAQITVAAPIDAALVADWRAWKARAPRYPMAASDPALLADLHALLARGLHLGHRAVLTPGIRPDVDESDTRCLLSAADALGDQGTPAALDDLDPILAALSPPDSYDAMRTWCVAMLNRDELALKLRATGRLPRERARRWRTHEDDLFGNFLAAAESEHRYWEPAYWSWRVGSDPVTFAWNTGFLDHQHTWWNAANDASKELAAEAAALDATIKAGCFVTGSATDGTRLGGSTHNCLLFLGMHHLACLAEDVMDRSDQEGALPADGAGLALDVPGLPRATYQRLDARRFIITTAKSPITGQDDHAVWLLPDQVVINRLGSTAPITMP